MNEQSPQQLQLELPDYRQEYEEWLRKQQKVAEVTETVIILDIY